MKVQSWIDKKTASKWVLRLEIPAEEMAMAKFEPEDSKFLEERMSSTKVSDIMLAAYIYALRVEQGLAELCSQNESAGR